MALVVAWTHIVDLGSHQAAVKEQCKNDLRSVLQLLPDAGAEIILSIPQENVVTLGTLGSAHSGAVARSLFCDNALLHW